MMHMKHKIFGTALALGLFMAAPAQAQNTAPVAEADAVTLQQLLDQVRAGRVNDNAELRPAKRSFVKIATIKITADADANAIKREEARSAFGKGFFRE